MNTNKEVKVLKKENEQVKLSLQEFIDNYYFSTEFLKIEDRGENDLKALAFDFLKSYDVKDDDLVDYKKDGNDFRNDQTKEGHYWCDLSNEWADGQVDVFNSDLYKKVRDYADYIEERLSEVGGFNEDSLIGAIQGGQYVYYSCFSAEVLCGLREYISEKE